MQSVDEEDIVGKTVKVAYMGIDNDFAIRFTDDTYMKIVAKSGYYNGVDLEYDPELSDYDKMKLGFISFENYEEIQQKKKERSEEQNRKWRQSQYETLKKEFEKVKL